MFVEREELAEKSSSAEEKQFSLAFAACKNVIHATLLTNVSPAVIHCERVENEF